MRADAGWRERVWEPAAALAGATAPAPLAEAHNVKVALQPKEFLE